MADVWVLSCPCGWTKIVPIGTSSKRRRQILEDHRNNQGDGFHGPDRLPYTNEGSA